MTLLAFAAERRRPQLSIDAFYPQGVQQQTRRQPLNGTDRRTPDRYIDPACSYAAWASAHRGKWGQTPSGKWMKNEKAKTC